MSRGRACWGVPFLMISGLVSRCHGLSEPYKQLLLTYGPHTMPASGITTRKVARGRPHNPWSMGCDVAPKARRGTAVVGGSPFWGEVGLHHGLRSESKVGINSSRVFPSISVTEGSGTARCTLRSKSWLTWSLSHSNLPESRFVSGLAGAFLCRAHSRPLFLFSLPQ